jgi:hypothetical protein
MQEEVEAGWMALMMSVDESMFELIPGLGILVGGAASSIAGPRAALGIGGVGSLIVAAAVWVVLAPGVLRAEAEHAAPTAARVALAENGTPQPGRQRPASPAQSQHPQ